MPPDHPIASVRPAPGSPSAPVGRVLLVEDDVVAANLYRHALAGGKLDVAHVTSAESAIEHLSQYSGIECVITDIGLPDLDGFEVLRASKILRPSTPVLIMTASDDRHHPGHAMREGADDFLFKPVDPQELVVRVTALIHAGRHARTTLAHSVLAIGAHPDDVEIGVAGTLLRHLAEGDRVVHLMMTDGETGGDRTHRVAEAERAAHRLGCTLVRAELRDAFLADDRATVTAIERVVAEYMPSVVYTHSAHDAHQDHRNVHHAAMSATRGVASIYSYQSPSCGVEFMPTRFVDIGDYLDEKLDLINLYRSQTSTRVYLAEDLIRATARYWGRHAGHRLVEPFEVIRQVEI